MMGASSRSRASGRVVERRRHDQHAQILAHRFLALETEREAEIGVEAALVKLVEKHAADVLERRV